MVPQDGLEPSRAKSSQDFESGVSTNSTTAALKTVLYCKTPLYKSEVVTASISLPGFCNQKTLARAAVITRHTFSTFL